MRLRCLVLQIIDITGLGMYGFCMLFLTSYHELTSGTSDEACDPASSVHTQIKPYIYKWTGPIQQLKRMPRTIIHLCWDYKLLFSAKQCFNDGENIPRSPPGGKDCWSPGQQWALSSGFQGTGYPRYVRNGPNTDMYARSKYNWSSAMIVHISR